MSPPLAPTQSKHGAASLAEPRSRTAADSNSPAPTYWYSNAGVSGIGRLRPGDSASIVCAGTRARGEPEAPRPLGARSRSGDPGAAFGLARLRVRPRRVLRHPSPVPERTLEANAAENRSCPRRQSKEKSGSPSSVRLPPRAPRSVSLVGGRFRATRPRRPTTGQVSASAAARSARFPALSY